LLKQKIFGIPCNLFLEIETVPETAAIKTKKISYSSSITTFEWVMQYVNHPQSRSHFKKLIVSHISYSKLITVPKIQNWNSV
jgi:hypothetical protein